MLVFCAQASANVNVLRSDLDFQSRLKEFIVVCVQYQFFNTKPRTSKCNMQRIQKDVKHPGTNCHVRPERRGRTPERTVSQPSSFFLGFWAGLGEHCARPP